MTESSQIKMNATVLTQSLIFCFSKVRRTFAHTLDTWGEQDSWKSSSGGRPQKRWRRDYDHVQPRRLDGGTDQSNLSSCWGEAGRSPDEAGTFPLLCSVSWTGTPTWHLPSGGKWRQRHTKFALVLSLNCISVICIVLILFLLYISYRFWIILKVLLMVI